MNQTQWIKLHRGSLSLLVGVIFSAQIHHLGIPNALAITDAPLPQAENCDAHLEGQWTWVDNSGQNKTDEELFAILNQHKTWLDTGKTKGRQADLSGTKLKGADLRSVNLSEANLTNSDLSYADLTRTTLNGTALRGTNLQCARLNETYLQRADLKNVDFSRAIISSSTIFDAAIFVGASLKGHVLRGIRFSGADLRGADLSSTDLTNAAFGDVDFRDANLREALLVDTNFNVAHLEGADLFGATYEVTSPPKTKTIAFAKNIEFMTYRSDPGSLARLRAAFKEAGFRDQERKITFALKSRQTEILWETCENAKGNCFEYVVNRYLFDITSQYGMNPGRVLVMITIIFIVWTALYWGLVHFSNHAGLSIVVPSNRENQPRWLLANLEKLPQDLIDVSYPGKREFKVRPQELHDSISIIHRELALLWVATVFSLMSTFNIKFKDVDFGRWLRQLTTKEYDIKATGLARTLSGIQALFSVYLIALLLITYFGRPFE